MLLLSCVAANIALLFVFKYLGFSIKIIDMFLRQLHFQPLKIINFTLPIGISFYTFQEISYLVDVYRKPESVQKSVLNLGLFIAFFPQLIAGPIVRYSAIIAQIESRRENIAQFAAGLERFITGLSKKILIANTMARVCDTIYAADFFNYGSRLAWIAAVAYALQIYYDFSGYSDMAIGLARLFGFELSENFNYPYAASSITDFWRRWHISLTSFFRDYVYIPLGGNRKGRARTVFNRFIVFFTTGLWHGASVNFVLWGLIHGALMSLERAILGERKDSGNELKPIVKVCVSIARRIFHRAITLFAVLLLWVLFRNGTKQTVKLILKMFGVNYTRFSGNFNPFFTDPFLTPNVYPQFFFIAGIAILFSFPWWRKIRLFQMQSAVLTAAKYTALLVLLVQCFANLAGNSYNPFIYFRF